MPNITAITVWLKQSYLFLIFKLSSLPVEVRVYEIWAATWQNQQNECAPSEEADQSLLCTQWVIKDQRFLHANSQDWSDWADAQADPSLHWAHSHFVGFVMSRLTYICCQLNNEMCWHICRYNKDSVRPHKKMSCFRKHEFFSWVGRSDYYYFFFFFFFDR